MNTKQSKFVNQGFEEMSLSQLSDLMYSTSGIAPDNTILKHSKYEYIPRIIFKNYVEDINNYSRLKKAEGVCLVIESKGLKIFYSPFKVLKANAQLRDEQGIREMLGEKDNLTDKEQDKIESIIYYVEKANNLENIRQDPNKERGEISKYSHIERKRLENILESRPLEDVYFNGHAYSAISPSKKTDEEYKIQQKGFVKFLNGKIIVPDELNINCGCGFGQADAIKFDKEKTQGICAHMELLRQTLINPALGKKVRLKNKYGSAKITSINNLFTPFEPLVYPEKATKKVRGIIRNLFFLYTVPNDYIKEYFNDKNGYHKSNGFTLFDSEADAISLLYNDVLTKEFNDLWNKKFNEKASMNYTCNYFRDYKKTGNYIKVNAEHFFDEDTKIFKHLIDDEWKNVSHIGIDTESKLEGPILSCQFRHKIGADSSIFHKITDSSITNNLSIEHVIEEMTPIINYTKPFKVAVMDNGIKVYIRQYQLRDILSSGKSRIISN
ncbi:MAG: hypothetical protein WC393_05165 [Candidatus Nanoarchaeia archaeon]|jgi:hypothetical protein